MGFPILDRIGFALGWIGSCEGQRSPRSEGVLVRILRGIAGALLWIVSAVLGLAAVVLCITVILCRLVCHCWGSRAVYLESRSGSCFLARWLTP
jgi:hypothetical protein